METLKNKFAAMLLLVVLLAFAPATVAQDSTSPASSTVWLIGNGPTNITDQEIAEWESQGEGWLHPLNFVGIFEQRVRFREWCVTRTNARAAADYTRSMDAVYLNWNKQKRKIAYLPVPAKALVLTVNVEEMTAIITTSDDDVIKPRILPWDIPAPSKPPQGVAVVGSKIDTGWYGRGQYDTTAIGDTTEFEGMTLIHIKASMFARFWVTKARLDKSFPHLQEAQTGGH